MNLSPEKKKEILLQSFDVLKEDLLNNSSKLKNLSKLKDIIVKMVAVDIDTAVEMWIFLLEENGQFLEEEDEGYWLTGGIAYNAGEKIGTSRISEIVINNDLLKQAIFNQYINPGSENIVHNFIYSNNPAVVNDLLQLVYTNKHRHKSFGKYFEGVLDEIEEDKSISEEVSRVLLFWADKVMDKQEKARINVALLDILSDQDDDEE